MGGGRSASPPDGGSHALFTPMSLHEYASYIDFEVGTNPAVRVCAVVPTHHLRTNHIISHFGTSHVLLGKIVAMGGCNLKMKQSWRGVGGGRSTSPPDAGSHALFTPMSLHEYASYIDFEVGTNPTVRVCAVVPTHHLRTNHIISHFGTSHVLLGKIVAMGGGNLKIKNAGAGFWGHALFTPVVPQPLPPPLLLASFLPTKSIRSSHAPTPSEKKRARVRPQKTSKKNMNLLNLE